MKECMDAQLITFLQDYIQLNTAHPYPDYNSVCTFFKNYAEQDDLDCKIILLPNNKPVIVITLSGIDSTIPGLILNHHMDVVPAHNHNQWIRPPFEGSIYNDEIIGRGAQDCKGLGAIHYFVLKELKKENIPLKRTLYLTIVPDEEIGGFSGTQEFIATDFFKSMNAQFILDEGIASNKKDVIAIKVTERKPLQIKITTQGSLAHGSKLKSFNAIHELVEILQEFTHMHRALQESAQYPAGLLLSTNITSLVAGDGVNAINIIPDYAIATIDIRVPPYMEINEMKKIIGTIINRYTHSSYTILAEAGEYIHSSFEETILYSTLSRSIKEYGLSPEPHFFEASSDLRFYKELGFDGFGFSPFTCSDNIHGTNESITLSDLIQAKNILFHFIKNFCV